MKTNYLVLSISTLLVLTASLRGAESSTDTNSPSCCHAALAPSKPLADKSIYQLDVEWADDAGQRVALRSLRGRPQIIAMFFTSCQSTCPLLVHQMKQIEGMLPAAVRTNLGFTLVSFDPVRDTPKALQNYRAQRDLGENWTLLRGAADDVLELSVLLGIRFKQDATGQFMHSNLITLLNGEGEIVYQQTGLGTDNDETLRRATQLAAP